MNKLNSKRTQSEFCGGAAGDEEYATNLFRAQHPIVLFIRTEFP